MLTDTDDEVAEAKMRPTHAIAGVEETEPRPDLVWDDEVRDLCDASKRGAHSSRFPQRHPVEVQSGENSKCVILWATSGILKSGRV
jgi:hypothetical protein